MAHVSGLRALEGAKFVPARTEMSDAPAFYRYLGFEVKEDERVGEYWSQIPSAELVQNRIDRWNQHYRDEPRKQIHVRYLTAGAHQQVAMARYKIDGYIGMADPWGVHTEPYAPTNSAPPSPADHQKLVIDPKSGRVIEANGLFNHDVSHMANAVYMDKQTLDSMKQVSAFYSEVFDLFKKKGDAGNNLRMTNVEAEQIRAALLQYKMNGQTPVDESKPGIAATRYISMQLLYSQSSYHGYEHLLGWLIRHPEGLDPSTFVEPTRGSTFQREANFHLMRLGVRKPGAPPYFMSPVGVLTHAKASDTQGPMTLERALDFVINTDRERAQTLLKDLRQTFRSNPEISAALDTIAAKYEKGLSTRLSPEAVAAIARETRERYRVLGQTAAPPP